MGLRVLVADDDTELLAVVTRALELFGARVVSVKCGGDLLEAIANDGAFDVIVTDIQMPWMTGLHVMHAVRTAGSPVPVIVMTGYRGETLPAQVRSLGVHAQLLHKPFGIGELFDALERVINPASALRTPAPSSGRRA